MLLPPPGRVSPMRLRKPSSFHSLTSAPFLFFAMPISEPLLWHRSHCSPGYHLSVPPKAVSSLRRRVAGIHHSLAPRPVSHGRFPAWGRQSCSKEKIKHSSFIVSSTGNSTGLRLSLWLEWMRECLLLKSEQNFHSTSYPVAEKIWRAEGIKI